MKIVLDASSAINLANGEVLNVLLRLKGTTFVIGPIVLNECGTHRPSMEACLSNGTLSLIDENDIPAAAFLDLLQKYALGDGETECLVVALADDDVTVACDDAAARRRIADELGPERLVGSLGLLREAVRQALMTAAEAMAAYEQMRSRGGFLPDVSLGFFEEA